MCKIHFAGVSSATLSSNVFFSKIFHVQLLIRSNLAEVILHSKMSGLI